MTTQVERTVNGKSGCPAKNDCEWTFTMNYGEVEVPYIIIAQSKEKPEDKCEEKGNLIIKAFYGYLTTSVSSNYEFFSEPFFFTFTGVHPLYLSLRHFK